MATPQTLPAAGTWKLRAPARPDPSGTRMAGCAKGPGAASTRRRRAREGTRAPPASRPASVESRGPLRVRPPPQHTPGAPPRGEVHARGPREAGASVTHPGEESPASGIAAQTQKARRPAPQLPPNRRSGVSEAAISEAPSLPSFKPLASGAAGPREAPSPAPPRGPSGRPRRKRSRGARRPYAGPIISRVGRGSGVLLYVSRQARFTDPRQRSRKGKILNTAHPGGFSLKRLYEDALGAAASLV